MCGALQVCAVWFGCVWFGCVYMVCVWFGCLLTWVCGVPADLVQYRCAAWGCVCVHACKRVCACVRVCMCRCGCACMCECVCVCVCVLVSVRVCALMVADAGAFVVVMHKLACHANLCGVRAMCVPCVCGVGVSVGVCIC